MRFVRLAALLVPVAAALALTAARSVRKDPNGIYAIIDSVIVEPSRGKPERIQLWGQFALANVVGVKDGKIDYIQLGWFHPPKRGFMYYTVNPRDVEATYVDWAMLRAAEGTGRLVAWGAHIPEMDSLSAKLDTAMARIILTYNGRVRTPGEPMTPPDIFPQRMRGASKVTTRFRGPNELGFTTPDTARRTTASPPPESQR